MKRPLPTEYSSHVEHYISLVKGDNVIKSLGDQILSMQELLAETPEDKEDFSYAPGKWTLKEVVGHMIDTERVFAYRALCFGRGDNREIHRVDENLFVSFANFNNRTLYDFSHEFSVIRESTIHLFKNFNEEARDRKGTANNKPYTVRALMFLTAGHVAHHMNVIKERYLV